MKSILAVSAAVAVLAVAGSAGAASYDAVGDFSAASATGVWSYGTGVTGSTFTPYTNYSSVCEGAAGLGCWQTSSPVDRVPLVLKNFSGSTEDVYGTVVQPTDVLNVHPGPDTDSIVVFTASTSSKYTVSGFFETLDVNPSGVNVILGGGTDPLSSTLLSGEPASFPDTPGGQVMFDETVYLNAGQSFYFGVNNDGSYYNDSTGLSATITAVPEPASWAVMLAGFGGLGALMRSRRKMALSAA